MASAAASPQTLLLGGAYARLCFHALRFPSSPVGGILIGSKDKHTGLLTVHDALPVAHTNLMPALWEAALRISETYAEQRLKDGGKSGEAENSDFGIVGAYFANEHLDDNSSLAPVPASVASSVRASLNGSQPVVLLLDNRLLGDLDSKLVVQAMNFDEAKRMWLVEDKADLVALAVAEGSTLRACSGTEERELLQRVLLLLRAQLENVRDFEEHMDAPDTVSWLPDPTDRTFDV